MNLDPVPAIDRNFDPATYLSFYTDLITKAHSFIIYNLNNYK